MKKLMGLSLAAAMMLPGVAMADWPTERPIDMIVAYSAGGGTDILARTMVPFLEKYIEGARFVVVNRPGAGGEFGFTESANADPDGYTIGFINAPAFLTLPYERETRYTFESFEPIANLVTDPASLIVRADSNLETLAEFIDYAQENPNALTVGQQGYGGSMHLSLEAMLRSAEIEVTQVPFPGIPPASTALLGGHIAANMWGLGEAAPLAEEGSIRVLGVMARDRVDLFPDAPTFAEQGYDLFSGSDRGFAAPAGTPAEIISALAEAVERTLEDPEFLAAAEAQFLPLNYMGPEEYKEHLGNLNQQIGELWETNPWR
ncbi:MAG: tripartite tricarboxylate transporter substrate binding protein [Salinarimonas sp.]